MIYKVIIVASKRVKEIGNEISKMKEDIKKLSSKNDNLEISDAADPKTILNYMILQKERTDKILMGLSEQLKRLEEDLRPVEDMEPGMYEGEQKGEIGLSDVDVKIVNFMQTKHNEMACADDISKFMNYKGKNAACARLKRLEMVGMVKRLQLGHTVYYKIDAGKTTKTLIVSPPQ